MSVVRSPDPDFPVTQSPSVYQLGRLPATGFMSVNIKFCVALILLVFYRQLLTAAGTSFFRWNLRDPISMKSFGTSEPPQSFGFWWWLFLYSLTDLPSDGFLGSHSIVFSIFRAPVVIIFMIFLKKTVDNFIFLLDQLFCQLYDKRPGHYVCI